ncbi:hypothetical protein SAMN05216350_10644 [Polaromonas sp. YR568]|uniref:hypothetical protein n=1 Tax=Polaromonas sp. YR568 TaxID=1855301 RepID=UPI0008E2CDF1|nr:hypothetical protein [Polaromonas sp. YR568]SFU83523.1 hypothetical protein SAMN05216350_10644 [Polaromonas sp. YR568]
MLTAQAIGLDPALYAAALRYLFDRPVPLKDGQEWYWDIDEPEFVATPLEWTRIQTVLFANAGADLAPYDNQQVGMGLNHVMSNNAGNIPHMAVDASVPLADAMQMMQAFPSLWRDCIGPRLDQAGAAGDASSVTRLDFVCHMWFDVWPTFWNARHISEWRDAQWLVLSEMLDMPCREVQRSALHGIGHSVRYLQRDEVVRQRIARFVDTVKGDIELVNYALAAADGMVQ